MREVKNENIFEEIEYINKELRRKKRGFKKIAFEEYSLNDTDLLEILKGYGYTKIKNQFLRAENITSENIEVIEFDRQVIEPVKDVLEVDTVETTDIIPASETTELSNIDTTKLNLLLDHLDHLLKLIPKENCIYRSNIISVKTLRVDSGLYEELRHRAEAKNETISELLNKAIENYLTDFK